MKLRSTKVRLALASAVLAFAALAVVQLRARRGEPLVTASGRALTAFCGAAVRSLCQKRISCGQTDRAQLDVCIEDLGAECERSLGWKLRQGVLSLPAGEPQEECLEGIGEASCNALQLMLADDEPNLFEITNRCEPAELLQPRSGLGDPCAETTDCTAGYCPGLAPECHRCRAYLAEGQPCQAGLLVCDPEKARCAAAPAGPDRCVPLAPAAGCSEGGGGTCPARIKTGDPCTGQGVECAEPEATCVAGRCQVRPYVLSEGEACRDFSDCRPGLHCKGARGGPAAGHCLPQAVIGEPCAALDFGGCSADAACVNSRCRRLYAAGERCAGPFLCKGFLSCVPAVPEQGYARGGTCVPDSVAGQPCNRNLACAASFCDSRSGRCVPLGGGGEPCSVPEQCESHWCIGGPSKGTCYAPCPAGMTSFAR